MAINNVIKYALLTFCLASFLLNGYADDYAQNFDSWTQHTSAGDYSEEGWATTNVLIRGGGFGWPAPLSVPWSCWLYNEPDSAIYTPYLTNTAGSITLSHMSKTIGGSYPQVVAIEAALTGSGPFEETARFTNNAAAWIWSTSTLPINSYSNVYVRIRKLSDNGNADQYLAIDDISITTIPDLIAITSVSNYPVQPTVGEDTTVHATIAAIEPGISSISATLHYSTDDGTSYTPAPMTNSSPTNFSYKITGQPSPILVLYYIEVLFQTGTQDAPPTLHPAGGPDAPLSYSHALTMGNDRLENFDDWGNLTALGTYVHGGWEAANSYIRSGGFGWVPGPSSPNACWLDDLAGASDPHLLPPQLDGVGTVYFEHRSKLQNDIEQIVALETSSSPTGPWTTHGYITNAASSAAWETNFVEVNVIDIGYVRVHKIEDGLKDGQYFGLDNVVISYPPADVIITNVNHSLGYTYTTNEMIVSCDIETASTSIPAGNLQPKVCYRQSASAPWVTNVMSIASNSTYSGVIPAIGSKARVEYFIRCDFDGYYYFNSFNTENQSPAFSPDGPETEQTPDDFHHYIVRPFKSDFERLKLTSSFADVTMELVDDYTWQAVLDMSLDPQASLTFEFLGFGKYTNGAPAYSTQTNRWGDSTHGAGDIPQNDVAQEDGNPITINAGTSFDGPVIFIFDTKTLDYRIVRGHYQNFNNWNTADSDYYEKTIFGIATTSITNTFDSFPVSTELKSNEADGTSAHFDNFDKPLFYSTDDEDWITTYWTGRNALLHNARAVGGQTNKFLSLQTYGNSAGGASWIRTSEGSVPDGLKSIDFKYRCAQVGDHPIVINNPGQNWSNVYIEVGLKWGSVLQDDAAIRIKGRYDGAGDHIEARFHHELDTDKVFNVDLRYNAAVFGSTNQLGGVKNWDNKHIDSYSKYGLMMVQYTNALVLESPWGGNFEANIGDFNWHRQVPAPAANGTNIALSLQSCDVDVDYVTVSPAFYVRWVNYDDGYSLDINETNMFFLSGCTLPAYPRMTNNNSFIISPYLGFKPSHFRITARELGDLPGMDLAIYGSTNRLVSGGIPQAGTLIRKVTDDKAWHHQIIDIPDAYNYIWICQTNNASPTTEVCRVKIIGEPIYTNHFDAATSTNGIDIPTGMGWSLQTNDSSLYHPGYGGEPITFSVDVSPADFVTKEPNGTWTTVYTDTVTNFNYQPVSIDLETPTPFFEHAEPIHFRIRNNENWGGGNFARRDLVVDNIDYTDWHADNIGSITNWNTSQGWVTENGSDRVIELPRDKAYKFYGSNYYQYVQTAISTNGVSSVGFSYFVEDAPVTFAIKYSYTNNMALGEAAWTETNRTTITTNSTKWLDTSFSLNDTNSMAVRIYNVSTGNTANIKINNLYISDFAGVVPSAWVGNNTLITYKQDNKEFEPALTPESSYRTCYLNKDHSSGTRSELPTNDVPYLETPYWTNGIGMVSFWYRHYDDPVSTPGTLELYGGTNRSVGLDEWDYLGSLTGITNTEYNLFSKSFYEKTYNHLRIVNGTNGIPSGRVCIDNVLLLEPMGARIDLANLKTIPTVPLYNTRTRISVELAGTTFNATNINMWAYYKVGTNSWGDWTTNEADGYFTMTNGTGSIYTSTGTIPTQSIDKVVQYYVYSTFTGEFSNSPLVFKDFNAPSWYYPVDLNTNAPKNVPYYFTFSCTTGSVWINEYNIWDDFNEGKQFIEVCGQENANIGSWQLDILDTLTNIKTTYDISPGTLIDQNPTDGFAFWLLGDTNIVNRDHTLTNLLAQNDNFRLQRSMGAYVPPIVLDALHPDDFFEANASVSLIGTGFVANAFTWNNTDNTQWSPGFVNNNQQLTDMFGPNPYLSIEILDTWRSGNQTYIVYDVTGTNFYLPPVPLYSTNIADTGSWQTVTSSSYDDNGANTYTSWWNNVAGDCVFHRISFTNIFTP